VKVRYIGPAGDGVVIAETGQFCALGGEVEVFDQLGVSLLDQESCWQPVTKSKATAKAAAEKE
jgi:hypothetical protein